MVSDQVVIGGEGGPPLNAFLSFKGQVTKCCVEHIRAASSLESLAADVWEDAITELLSQTRGPTAATEAADDVDGRLPQIPEEEQQGNEDVAQTADGGVPLGEAAPSETLQPPLTAAPGTSVGQLFERLEHFPWTRTFRPKLFDGCDRQTLLPNMERQSVERGLERGSEDTLEQGGVGRRPSIALWEPPLSMRRVASEPREVLRPYLDLFLNLLGGRG